ncbi:QueT transporter family protein [Clostridium sp. C8-1-8]|uniref:QueT transporter family protein n=1 Tax=Clostridium sp. C8-1-8 TaxID=2698831 RepID=UPI00136B4CF2|nr:QueT transporter family protein [Clostridium sp. C8-1-8]
MNTQSKIRFLAYTAIVAALYVVITLSFSWMAYGPIQLRISEVLVLLAFIDRKYIPGLVLGCILANLSSPIGPLDIGIGAFATFLAVFFTSRTKNLFIATLWPTIFNGLIVGGELYFLGFAPNAAFGIHPLILSCGFVAIGEFVVVSIVGYILFNVILKNKNIVNALKITR